MKRRGGRRPKHYVHQVTPQIQPKPSPVPKNVPSQEEEEDVLDVLIEEQKRNLRRKKLEEAPRMVRPPIRFAKHAVLRKTDEIGKELLEVQKKVKEKKQMLEIARKKYREVVTFSTEQNSGISKGVWIHIVSFLDVKSILTMKLVNTLFNDLVHMDEKWEKFFYSMIPKELNFEIAGSTFLEKFKFVYNCENHDPLGLEIVSASGGSSDLSFEVDNMLYATYDTIPQNSSETPRRRPYSTKYGSHSNVDIVMRMRTNNLIFKGSIQIPSNARYKDPVNNALVFVSENEFTKDVVKKISETYNHVLKKDIKEVIGRAKREGLPVPSFQFFGIAHLGKESNEEKRTANRVSSPPVFGKFVLLKMIDHEGDGLKIDICGFSLHGLTKGF